MQNEFSIQSKTKAINKSKEYERHFQCIYIHLIPGQKEPIVPTGNIKNHLGTAKASTGGNHIQVTSLRSKAKIKCH